MEDPWGTNAWSASDPEKNGDSSKEILDPPKWNTFERDADENTIDVGVPSWSVASGSGWGEGTNLWHAESSTLDGWKPSLNIGETREEPDLEPGEEDATEQEEDNKYPEPRAVLPTPPLSPLPLSSTTAPLADTSQSSLPPPLINPPSPDHFGSFESAEFVNKDSHDSSSWTPKAPHFPPEATDEPWGAAWGGDETEDEGEDKGKINQWKLAQETRRKRDRKAPPQLLDSLVTQWDDFATSLYPVLSTEHNEYVSWQKGLDSVDGLAELVDSLIPVTSFPPPTPFNKTAVAKSVKETLRLTRSFPLTQSSPMAHLHASKGSTDWEKSVKAQKTAANDEWGWDLKHEPEEKASATDSAKDKKSGGLLSFWSRKSSATPIAPVGDLPAANSPISSTVVSKPTSPAMSARPSIDSSQVASPTTATSLNPPLPPDDVVTGSTDFILTQPSAVSRFFNRFSRKPSAVPTLLSGQEKRTSLSLSSDDLSFLSDMTPSTTEGSLQFPPESASINSLGAMLSWPSKNSSPSSSKLPPPLAPPPRGPHPTGHNHKPTDSLGSGTSLDAERADAQFMDLLDKAMGGDGDHSSSSGYAPVITDLLESPEETSLPALQSRDPRIRFSLTSLSSLNQPPTISPISTTRAQSPISSPHIARDAHMVASDLLPPIPPPHSPDGTSRHGQSITLARFHNPLPPTPKRGLDDLADFLSTSPPSGRSSPLHSPLLPQYVPRSPSTKVSTTTSLLSSTSNHSSSIPTSNKDDSVDFGDFGDFISTPIRTPSPPKVPKKTVKTSIHKPTLELVQKGASRQGRWPAPPSPLPLPLAPPAGSSLNSGYFNISQRQQPLQLDLFTSDDSLITPASVSGSSSVPGQASISQPLFAAPSSRPASTVFEMAPTPLPPLSVPRTSSPSLTPNSVSSQQAKGSGLSAQDLSFFEGL